MVALIDEDLTHKNIVVSLSKLVTKEPSLYSVFIAKENNDFYQLISLSDDSIRSRLGAKERDAWLLCMQRALAEQPYADDFKQYLIEQLFVPAERSRNRD